MSDRIINALKIANERWEHARTVRRYSSVIIGSILFIAIGGMLLSSSLNMRTDTTSQFSFQNMMIIAKTSANENLVKDESIQLEVNVKNEIQKPITYSVYPSIIFSGESVYNGTKNISIVQPNETQTYHYTIPFREIGRNSALLIVHANDTVELPFRLKNFNVVSQERYYQIQDQQFYYNLLGVIAIPIVISTIKNLKDIFDKRSS